MNKYAQKKRIIKFMKIYGCVFLCLIAGISIASVIAKDRDFSPKEKRNLSTISDINLNDLANGSLSTDFENYASDQIFGRDMFINIRSGFSLLMGKHISQGVFYCSSGYLIEKMDEAEDELIKSTLKAIGDFSENTDINSTFVLIPNAVSICSDLLPDFAITENQSEVMDFIKNNLSDAVSLCDLTDTLNVFYENGNEVYYHTDHHWTSEAAYESLQTIASYLGINPKVNYTPLLVCDSFNGSLSSKSGYKPVQYDSIYIYKPEYETNYIVTNMDTKTKTADIYSLKGLSSSDPYTVFLGGNASHINIKTDNADKKHLLVFKDSYFNCFLPFLISEFSEIDIIDPRYYYENINELLIEKDFDEILYFYNLNTFCKDTSLIQVLGGSY